MLDDKLKDILPDKEPVLEQKYGYKIPVCTPYLLGNEMQYLSQAIESTRISGGSGEFIKKFEVEFAKKTGAQYAVSCNSGTSALHVAYRLIGIERGDEVIVPDFTMVSTVTPLIEMGAIPIFIDCDDKGNIDVNLIEAKITEKTKAIVATHIYGHPVEIEAIEKLATKHHLKVVYDAAEAHGALYKNQKLGKFGDVVCYSFYANKVITTGEGGMVTMNNIEFKKKADRLVDEYFSEERHFWHEDYGYSYRMSNLMAAIGLGQTEKLEELVKLRRKNFDLYAERVAGIEGISVLAEDVNVQSVRWMVGIFVDPEKFGKTRNQLREELAKVGVETRTFFVPMHLQPVMIKLFEKDQSLDSDRFPMSEKLCAQGMYLPSGSALADHAIVYIVDRIKEVKNL